MTVGDCTGVCGVGTYCDPQTHKCNANSAGTGGGGGTAAGGGGGAAASGLPCEVADAFAAKCSGCHGDPLAGNAPVVLLTREQLLATSPLGGTYAERSLSRMRSTTAPMPPADDNNPVTGAEAAALEAWINGGYPGGACASVGASPTGGGTGATGGGAGETGGGTAAGGGSATGGGTAAGGGAATGGGAGTGGGFSMVGGGNGGGSTGGGAAGGGVGGGAAGGGAAGGGSGSNYCGACTSDTDCGGGNNFCLSFSYGDFCGVDCSTTACGANQRCANIVDTNNTVVGKNCVPVSGQQCTGAGGGAGGGTAGGGAGGGTAGGGAGGGTAGGGAGGGGGTTCTTDTWASYGSSFFATTCDSCHTHTNEFSTQAKVIAKKSSIRSRVNSGNMPQGTSLSSTDRARIVKYLDCGVP